MPENATRSISVHVYPLVSGGYALQVWAHRWSARRPYSARRVLMSDTFPMSDSLGRALRAASDGLLWAAESLDD